jgi:S-adenosylmethionine:diacylglycerol 3-amino-3-carboxypropyl transferase
LDISRAIDEPGISHEAPDRVFSNESLLDEIFALLFNGLVYPQIWEDPEIDMEALEITPASHIVAIASGGCNILSYLTANPARITAVDLSKAHVAPRDYLETALRARAKKANATLTVERPYRDYAQYARFKLN